MDTYLICTGGEVPDPRDKVCGFPATQYSNKVSYCPKHQTRCVCEPQIPLIMANTKDGQGHKDQYLDTSRKILSQKMLMCNMKALISIILL